MLASHADGRVASSKTSRPRASTDPTPRRTSPTPSRRQASASASGSRTGGSGSRSVRARRSACGAVRPASSAHARPEPGCTASSEAAVGSIARCSAIALPSSKGCAIAISGATQVSPSSSSASSAKAGEAFVIGRNPAQWSKRKPGSVVSVVDVAPPGFGACSRTVTSSPAAARCRAHTSPLWPAPTTATRGAWADPGMRPTYPGGSTVTRLTAEGTAACAIPRGAG